MTNNLDPNLIVNVYEGMLDEKWVGFARHFEAGRWEFYPTSDTVGEPLIAVKLKVLLDADPSLSKLADVPPMSQAWRWEAGEDFQVSHLAVGPTYFFEVEVTPTPDNPEYGEIAGAIVNCWVRIQSVEAAQELVLRRINEEPWEITSFFGPEIHTKKTYQIDTTGIEYFEQAQIDGEVYVYHTYTDDDE